MNFLEKNLEDILFESDNKDLQERGLCISGFKKRQLRIGNYGIADLITISRGYIFDGKVYEPLSITIYELKQNEINYNSLKQIITYARGVQLYLEKRKEWTLDIDYQLDLILIGAKININDSFCYIPSLFKNIKFYTYTYKIDGIEFNDNEGYYITDGGF